MIFTIVCYYNVFPIDSPSVCIGKTIVLQTRGGKQERRSELSKPSWRYLRTTCDELNKPCQLFWSEFADSCPKPFHGTQEIIRMSSDFSVVPQVLETQFLDTTHQQLNKECYI